MLSPFAFESTHRSTETILMNSNERDPHPILPNKVSAVLMMMMTMMMMVMMMMMMMMMRDPHPILPNKVSAVLQFLSIQTPIN